MKNEKEEIENLECILNEKYGKSIQELKQFIARKVIVDNKENFPTNIEVSVLIENKELKIDINYDYYKFQGKTHKIIPNFIYYFVPYSKEVEIEKLLEETSYFSLEFNEFLYYLYYWFVDYHKELMC